MMAYDFHGSWTTHSGHNAPLYPPASVCYDGSADGGINYLTATRKVPREKLALGVPFYGREFSSIGLYQSHSGVSDLTYSTILPRLSDSSWEYYWDDISEVSYLKNTEHTKFVTFDDTVSIINKCKYAINKQLAGIMIWALGQDVVGDSQLLLETIGRNMGLVTSVGFSGNRIEYDFKLYDNYPNPFNPTTNIRFQIQDRRFITLKVYDILGNEIAMLINEEKPAGDYEIVFNASKLSSGTYFYRLQSGEFVETKKFVLIK
jgi:chitinase